MSENAAANYADYANDVSDLKARDSHNPRNSRPFTIFLVLGLAFLEYFIYFQSNWHFFQGDTIHWFYLRHRTIGDFLLSFVKLDPHGWYRPLSNRTIQSIFFPFWGLAPTGYRIAQYVLFLVVTMAVYKLAAMLTNRKLAACIATLFFSLHTVNAYTTYDLAFIPEISYTLLYVCAVIAYLRFRENNDKRLFGASVFCFIASLWAKEAAVTLPFMLIVLDMILNGSRIASAVNAVRVHLLVLVIYVSFIVGYLGVQRSAFQSILNRPGPEVAYRFALDQTILSNADYALTWAFNIPRGWHTQWRGLKNWMLIFLKAFRMIIAVLGVWLLFRPERKFVLLGLAWFLLALAPALPLLEHLIPYYLFLPLVGFSIVIGTILDSAFHAAATYSRAGAGSVLVLLLGTVFAICIFSVRNDSRGNRLLGYSSGLALNSISDLKARYPTLQPNTTIYMSDADEPTLTYDTSQGELFKIVYNDESIQTLFWGWGEVITKGTLARGPVVVMKYRQSHLNDVTEEFLAASEPAVSYATPNQHKLEVQPPAATAGQTFQLSVTGLTDTEVAFHYARDGGPVQLFVAHLDNNHQASFNVSQATQKGLYRFVGFRMPGTSDWIQAAGSIQIN